MQLSYTNKTLKIIAENPDERFSQDIARRLAEAVQRYIDEFFEEVRVAMRHVQDHPNHKVTLVMKPFTVEVSMTQEEKVVAAKK
jgi:hypothetical protein